MYIGKLSRKLKCQLYEHEEDSKLDFRKKWGNIENIACGPVERLKKTWIRLKFNQDVWLKIFIGNTFFERRVFPYKTQRKFFVNNWEQMTKNFIILKTTLWGKNL